MNGADERDMSLDAYLKQTEFIDFGEENVSSRATALKLNADDTIDLIKDTFEYVRDQIAHSVDARLHTPAAKASEVLAAGGSICWAKANLFAALLRANGIPSGISYQILTKGESPETGYMVHALNTVYVENYGWVRLDARGNKEGVDAQFSLDEEKLAFVVRPELGERDMHDNHPDADPELMKLIQDSDDILLMLSETVFDSEVQFA